MPHKHSQREAKVVLLISDKIDFRAKKITSVRETLHNDKSFNPPMSNPK